MLGGNNFQQIYLKVHFKRDMNCSVTSFYHIAKVEHCHDDSFVCLVAQEVVIMTAIDAIVEDTIAIMMIPISVHPSRDVVGGYRHSCCNVISFPQNNHNKPHNHPHGWAMVCHLWWFVIVIVILWAISCYIGLFHTETGLHVFCAVLY